MPITQAMTTSFKVGVLRGTFNFDTGTPQVFKVALYTSTATLDATTTAYSATNEVVGTGYTAGGATVTVSTVPTSTSTTAFLSFTDASWTTSTITARGAVIYLSNGGTNPSIAVLDFGTDKTSTGATFTVQMPVANSTTAIIRIA